MISMEKVNIRGDGVNEMKDKKPCSEFNRSNSNKPAISAPPINTSDESKIVALEKSVSFLRTQHALMLEGLHKEIENLRQVNRALQFRVVMCCCKLDDAEPDEIKRQCTIREEELVSEINSLKELLEAERKRNQALVKQIESMQLGRSVVRESKKASEITTSHSPSKGPTSDNRTASQPGSEKLHSLRPAHPKENKDLSSDYSNTERMRTPAELNLGTHARISSPELRPENSTSAIVLTPRTSVVSPEGFWVRKSIGNLNGVNQPDGLPTVPTNGQGQRAYSVRLPVLRANQQYQQAVVNDIPKGVVQSKLVSLQPNVNAAPLSNESSQAKAARVARGSLGHNSIAAFDTLCEFPSSHHGDLRPSSRPYTTHLGPFLPALPKSGDAGQAARQRKARMLQRKRLDRAQNLFPS